MSTFLFFLGLETTRLPIGIFYTETGTIAIMLIHVLITSENHSQGNAAPANAIESAIRSATLAPSNGGGHWVSALSRITRRTLGPFSAQTAVANVYEIPGEFPEDVQRTLMSTLLQRLQANFNNVGGMQWNINMNTYNPTLHGPLDQWTNGSAAITRTRDVVPGALEPDQPAVGPVQAGVATPEGFATSAKNALHTTVDEINRARQGLGISWTPILIGAGLVAIIFTAPAINSAFSRIRAKENPSSKGSRRLPPRRSSSLKSRRGR